MTEEGIVKKIKSFFRKGKKAMPAAGAVSQKSAQKRMAGKTLGTHIARMLRARRKVAASKLQVISLDRIKPLVKGNWEEFSSTVRSTINDTIMRRLGAEDSFTQVDDNTYIIVFDSLSKEDAELECVLIVQEVLRTLFPDQHLDDRVEIHTVAIGVDGKIDVKEVDLLDVILRLLKDEETKDAVDIAFVDTGGVQESAVAQVVVEPEFNFETAVKALPKNLVFKYRPYWDIGRKVLSTYSCIVTDGQTQGYGVLGHDPDRMLLPALDYLVIGRATHELKNLSENNSRLLISCPVHIDTLTEPRCWPTYHTLCERIVKASPKRDLIFDLFGVDANTPPHKLAHALEKLRRYGRKVVLRTGLSGIDPAPFSDIGVDYLCVDIGAHKGSEKRTMKQMDEYVESAQKHGLGTIATGLATLSQVTAAVASGFSKIAGDAAHPVISKPEFVFRFESKDLLRGLTEMAPPSLAGENA